MHGKRVWTILCVAVGIGVSLPLLIGQEPAAPPPSAPPAIKTASLVRTPAKRDLTKLSLLEREVYLAGQRGMEWLQRFNRPDGRFVSGYIPDLRSPIEGENYLQQAEAVLALARAARYYDDPKATARARQAMLTLLVETTLEPQAAANAPAIRHTTMPPILVNRLAAAGTLVLAVHELPNPGKDLLDQAGQLCNYLLTQQQADGSLAVDQDKQAAEAEIKHCTGPALQALARHNDQAVRKAHAVYPKWWRAHKNMAMIPRHTAAYAEAYLKTREQAFADTVFEMNDWLCELQYQQLDPRHPFWRGGFKRWRDGHESAEPPEISSALYAESLVHACRVARQAGDVRRWQRYQAAVEQALQFLTTLQYTDANTQHFAAWYRPYLLGAFHASHQDGNLRLDYTSRAVATIVLYLGTKDER